MIDTFRFRLIVETYRVSVQSSWEITQGNVSADSSYEEAKCSYNILFHLSVDEK